MVKPKPRPYYEQRIAHAEGYEIEMYDTQLRKWVEARDPKWHSDREYRVVPMRVEKRARAYIDDHGFLFLNSNADSCSNVKFVFDSRTNELISVEKI